MSSIQIDTKSLKLVIYYQPNNIKLSICNEIFHYVRSIDAVRLLDTLRVREAFLFLGSEKKSREEVPLTLS